MTTVAVVTLATLLMSPTYEATLGDGDVIEDGYYRVEVTSYDVISGRYNFAWSNPVFARVP